MEAEITKGLDEKRNILLDQIWYHNFDFKMLIESIHKVKKVVKADKEE